MDAARQGPQDFLVPDRRHALEIAVDQPDGTCPGLGGAIDIALGDRRQADEIAHGPHLVGR